MTRFETLFGTIPDPRAGNASHALTDLLFVSLVAVLCGARSCSAIALFVEVRLALLRSFVPLGGGAPSHDTLSRVLRRVDPVAFDAAFRRFMAAFGEAAGLARPAGVVAVDGKSLRGAYAKGCAHMPALMVSVFDSATFLTLAGRVAASGGEAKAAGEALRLLSLQGCTVTGDALHCSRATSEAVRASGGDYALVIKGNQSRLAREARAALGEPVGAEGVARTHDEAHGRGETRVAWVVPVSPSPGPRALVDLAAVGCVEATRSVAGRTTTHRRLYALSRLMSPDELLAVSRAHWAIENKLHWALDVVLHEDAARSRKDHAPANLALLRRLALNVLRAHPAKGSLALKQQRATWDPTFLVDLLAHMR